MRIALTDVYPSNLIATVVFDDIFQLLIDTGALLEVASQRLWVCTKGRAEDGIAVVHPSSIGLAHLQLSEVMHALDVQEVVGAGVSGAFAVADETDSVRMPFRCVLGQTLYNLFLLFNELVELFGQNPMNEQQEQQRSKCIVFPNKLHFTSIRFCACMVALSTRTSDDNRHSQGAIG